MIYQPATPLNAANSCGILYKCPYLLNTNLLVDDVPARHAVERRDQLSVALLTLSPCLLGQRLQQFLHCHGAVIKSTNENTGRV